MGLAKYRLIRVNEEEAFNGCLISLVVIGIVLYGIYTAGVFLMELLVYPFFLPNETDMSETYYTKIVVNETVPYLNTQLGEYLQSKGFSSDTNSPKLYKNIREGGRDKIDKVKYLGKGNYKTVTTLYVDLEYTDQNGQRQEHTNYYTYDTVSHIHYKRGFLLVNHDYTYLGCNCVDYGIVDTTQSPHQFQSFQR